jgi:hypothetical protein
VRLCELMGDHNEHIVFVEVLFRLVVNLSVDRQDVRVVLVGSVNSLLALHSGMPAIEQIAVDTGTKSAQFLKHYADLQYEHSLVAQLTREREIWLMATVLEPACSRGFGGL